MALCALLNQGPKCGSKPFTHMKVRPQAADYTCMSLYELVEASPKVTCANFLVGTVFTCPGGHACVAAEKEGYTNVGCLRCSALISPGLGSGFF
jgi:hypothetical protein